MRLHRVARFALLASVGALGGVIGLTRAGVVSARPWLVAVLAAASAAAAGGALAAAIGEAARGRVRRMAAGGEALFMAGLLGVILVGFANWLLDYRGFLLLVEGEQASIAMGGGLRDVSRGPLGSGDGLTGSVRLLKVELVRADGGFAAASRLAVTDDRGGADREIRVAPGKGVKVAGATLSQGAFGFVPRVAVQHQGSVLFDGPIPLETRRAAGRGVSFEGKVEDAGSGFTLAMAVSLDRLDEDMKGHPVLGVELRQGGELIGAGELLPGHGATLRDGWRVGFGGMKMWSEVDLVRWDFRTPTLLALSATAVGLLVWLVARRRAA